MAEDPGFFGQYRLLGLLGAGGMGQVFRAYDSATQRVVALKVLPPQLAGDSTFQERFRREAYASARLDDPHTVPIHSFGEINGRLYVDMRLIDGRDLGAILREQGPLEPGMAVSLIDQVASALDTAHRVGLVHRDVKPSNVLVTPKGFGYLIDFGIARAVEETGLTGTGHTLGTLGYMAPERFTDGRLDPRSDVYSLTCVLFECLTGRQPFPGADAQQQLAGHLMTAPPRVTDTVGGLPPAIDTVVATGMAKDPAQRYRTAPELAAAARAALTAGGGDSPRPPSAWAETQFAGPPAGYGSHLQPVQAGGGRRRAALLIAAALSVILVAAVGAATVTARKGGVAASSAQQADDTSKSRDARTGDADSATPTGYGEPITLPFGRLSSAPTGIAVTADKEVYITGMLDSLRLEAGSDRAVQIPGGVEFAWGVALDAADRVYITDANPSRPRVVRLGADGEPAETLPFTDLARPLGVAVDPAGNVYVADQRRNRVFMLTVTGVQLYLPFQDIRVASAVAVDRRGNVYLAQADVGVLKLSAGSTKQEVLPLRDLDTAFAIAVDKQDNVYVSDYQTGKVLRFDVDTNEQTELPFGDLVKPRALAVDVDGSVYVSDERNRVLKLPVR